MKLATLKSSTSLDGELVVISKDLKTFARAAAIAQSLREAVESWKTAAPALAEIYLQLNDQSYSRAEKITDDKIFTCVFSWSSRSVFSFPLACSTVAIPNTRKNSPVQKSCVLLILLFTGTLPDAVSFLY